jgi:hypothetical protein
MNNKPKFITMKNTTIFFWAIVILTVHMQLKAQDSFFDLKNYKTTNYERSSLDLQFNLNERASKSNSQEDYQLSQKQAVSNFYDNLDFNSTFSKILFTEKKIVEYGSNLSIRENYSNNFNQQIDSLTNFSKQINYEGNYRLSGYYNVDRYYSASNRNYFKLGGKASFGIDQSFQKTESSSNSTDINKAWPQFSSQFSIDLGHGHGRIENVENAVEALYILNDLSENGLLSRSYTESDVKTLADKITLIKKERFFDERLYKQKSMKALVSLLLDDNLIKSESVKVFNTIADYHYYAGIETRPSGKKLEYYLTPSLSYSIETTPETFSDISYKVDRTHLTGKLEVSTAYHNYKPISTKWQRNFYIKASVSNSWDRNELDYHSADFTNGGPFKTTTYNGNAQINYSYGYFPNTRTYINTGLSAYYSLDFKTVVDQPGESFYNYFTGELYVSAYYYLSSKLRLSGNFNLSASKHTDKYTYSDNPISTRKDININNNLAFALTYYIF